MNWRPKGWEENLLKVTYHNVSMEIYDEQEVKLGREFFTKGCEVGADAMLEALKKDGEYLHNTGTMPYGFILGRSLKLGEKGWLVFIPDKE